MEFLMRWFNRHAKIEDVTLLLIILPQFTPKYTELMIFSCSTNTCINTLKRVCFHEFEQVQCMPPKNLSPVTMVVIHTCYHEVQCSSSLQWKQLLDFLKKLCMYISIHFLLYSHVLTARDTSFSTSHSALLAVSKIFKHMASFSLAGKSNKVNTFLDQLGKQQFYPTFVNVGYDVTIQWKAYST